MVWFRLGRGLGKGWVELGFILTWSTPMMRTCIHQLRFWAVRFLFWTSTTPTDCCILWFILKKCNHSTQTLDEQHRIRYPELHREDAGKTWITFCGLSVQVCTAGKNIHMNYNSTLNHAPSWRWGQSSVLSASSYWHKNPKKCCGYLLITFAEQVKRSVEAGATRCAESQRGSCIVSVWNTHLLFYRLTPCVDSVQQLATQTSKLQRSSSPLEHASCQKKGVPWNTSLYLRWGEHTRQKPSQKHGNRHFKSLYLASQTLKLILNFTKYLQKESLFVPIQRNVEIASFVLK